MLVYKTFVILKPKIKDTSVFPPPLYKGIKRRLHFTFTGFKLLNPKTLQLKLFRRRALSQVFKSPWRLQSVCVNKMCTVIKLA